MKWNAVSDGVCRFCRKSVPKELPVGVLPPGTILKGQYLTGLYLGQGGFGITYRAYDLVNNRTVAIKEYYPSGMNWSSRAEKSSRIIIREQQDFEYGLKHFRAEAEILRELSDVPEVVRYIESFDENNTAYYVMELLEGQNLQEYLRTREGNLSFYQTVDLLMPMILGLEKIHRRNTTHRDIKPSNIYICNDSSVRILDFGAASAEGSVYAESFMPIVSEGYSPPEQNTISHDKGKQGPWSDVYATAGTIYRCVTGKRPPASSARQAGEELVFETGKLNRQQRSILEKNLSLVPENRCRSMLSFAQELLTGLKRNEAEALRTRYAELRNAPPQPPNPEPPNPEPPNSEPKPPTPVKPPVPGLSESWNPEQKTRARQAAAFCLDLLFFQLLPCAAGRLAGAETPPALISGFLAGTLVCWGMTCSDLHGSPGELICGLRVRHADNRPPEPQEALLYCLIRLFWVMKPADFVCLALTQNLLSRKLSGCTSVLKDGGKQEQEPEQEQEPKELVLQITEGLYAGDVVPLPPGRYTFGRYPDVCNLVFPMAYNVVSRVQCMLVVDAVNNIFITNESSQGTTVDDRKLRGEESVLARVGSEITFGREKMIIAYK